MKRGGLSALLMSLCIAIGIFTLVVCTRNSERAAKLDALHRSCQDLILRNAHSQAVVRGHRPGETKTVDVEIAE